MCNSSIKSVSKRPYVRTNLTDKWKIVYTYLFLQAKVDGFLPGGASLHNCMTPHGPDTKSYEVWLFWNHQLEVLISFIFFYVCLSILTTGKHCSVPFVELVYVLSNKIKNCWIQFSNVFLCCTVHHCSWERCRTSQNHQYNCFYVWIKFDSPYQPIGSRIPILGSWLLPMLDWSEIPFCSSRDFSWKPYFEQGTIKTKEWNGCLPHKSNWKMKVLCTYCD